MGTDNLYRLNDVVAARDVPKSNTWARAVLALKRFNRSPVALLGETLIALVVIMAIFAPVLAPQSPSELDAYHVLAQPSGAHWLGTDEVGRDILSRMIHGARVPLAVALISVALGVLVGVPLGMIAGYQRGWVDMVLSRIIDGFLAFPTLILAVAVSALLGQSLLNAALAIGVVYWSRFARLVRGQALSIREKEYVEAARAIGATSTRILTTHIAPNLASTVIVLVSISLASAILIEAALSFIGLGVQPPTPSWGAMLRAGYGHLEESIWPSIVPGTAIFLTVLGFNFLGDGLRDFLDPRLKER